MYVHRSKSLVHVMDVEPQHSHPPPDSHLDTTTPLPCSHPQACELQCFSSFMCTMLRYEASLCRQANCLHISISTAQHSPAKRMAPDAAKALLLTSTHPFDLHARRRRCRPGGLSMHTCVCKKSTCRTGTTRPSQPRGNTPAEQLQRHMMHGLGEALLINAQHWQCGTTVAQCCCM
jgi:hypothetical protein